MLKCAHKYGVEKYIQLNSEVLAATWDEQEGIWNVDVKRKDGTMFVDTCNVIVNGTGVVNKWKWPTIQGLHDFRGVLAHSAAWDTSIDWEGKTVAVIGTGSSSIQMVPKFAKTAKHVTVFMRNKTYIGPQFGSSVSNKEADPEALEPHAAGKHSYTEKEKERFRSDPEYHLKYRKALERAVVSGFKMFYRGTELNIAAKKFMQESMEQRLGDRDDLKRHFIPDWSPGCRRLTPGEGYLEALIQDNVSPVFDDIVRITPTGVATVDGTEYQADILACATGFFVQYQPHFRITGVGGQVMQDKTEPNVYASISVPGFPNYYVVNGPRGNWGQGCALPSHEVQVEYIVQCCKKMQEDGIRSMSPRQDVTTQLNLYMDAWHRKHSVWAEDCRSWYKDNKTDGRVYIWPGSLFHHLKFMKRPRYEHYEITYRDPSNIWAFLGNGLTITEEKFDGRPDLPIPYIRNDEDEAWDIE
jgi:cation diffusion facilitator CzcD-associated flavoprotein CzcO